MKFEEVPAWGVELDFFALWNPRQTGSKARQLGIRAAGESSDVSARKRSAGAHLRRVEPAAGARRLTTYQQLSGAT
jgi:hypothetical protein